MNWNCIIYTTYRRVKVILRLITVLSVLAQPDSNLVIFTTLLSIKSLLLHWVPSFLCFPAKRISIVLVSYPLFLKIYYLSSYIYSLNFKLKTFCRLIVFCFIKSQIVKKDRNLVLPLFRFLSNMMSLFSSSDFISKFYLNSLYLLLFFLFCVWPIYFLG